ncbi:MAG: ATP synthase F1 subunit epsilon [Lachnospiraceae bacterium]|nr:ATP synthase F1 subunit epsilon [Lachnospiraceae bacterium]MBR4173775.1 ATP synthase F1 subunit epsilon [Lachnospiraceae bacterium]
MSENGFKLQIISPDRVFYEGEVSKLELNTSEGEVGIYKRHMPMTMIIVPGVMIITQDDGEIKEAALHGGFLEVLPDKVTIMAEVVEWPDEIDVQRAEEAKKRAERRLAEHPEGLDILRAETALHRAIARIVVVK